MLDRRTFLTSSIVVLGLAATSRGLAAPTVSQPAITESPLLPISHCLHSQSDAVTEENLKALDARGIGYTVNWQPAQFEQAQNSRLYCWAQLPL